MQYMPIRGLNGVRKVSIGFGNMEASKSLDKISCSTVVGWKPDSSGPMECPLHMRH